MPDKITFLLDLKNVSVDPEGGEVQLAMTIAVFNLFQAVKAASLYLSAKNLKTVAREASKLLKLCEKRDDSFNETERRVLCRGLDFLKQFLSQLEYQMKDLEKDWSFDIMIRTIEKCREELLNDIK